MEVKEKAIIIAAKEIFARDGYSAASVKNIACRAGVASGTLYLYFDNKDSLFMAVMSELYEELLGAIKLARKSEKDTLHKLSASLRAALNIFAANREMAELVVLQGPNSNASLSKQVATMEDLLAKLVSQDIEAAVDKGLLPKQHALISSLAFVGSLNQVITSWLREGKPENLAEAVEPLIKYNLNALGAKTSD